MSPRPGVVSPRSAQARSTNSMVSEPVHSETSNQSEQQNPSRDLEARSSLGHDRSEQQNPSRLSEPRSSLDSYRGGRYRRNSREAANTEPKRMNKYLRILLQLPLLVCLCTCLVGVKIVSLACGPLLVHVKARAKFAKEEFSRRFKIHLKFISNGAPSDNEGPGVENTNSQTKTPPSSWPHRRKKNWVPSALKTAFKRRALYETTLELSKAITDTSARGGAVKTVARMQMVTEAIMSVQRLRMERNEGDISLEEQREEALRCYDNAFDEKFREVFVEEYHMIENGFRGYIVR